LTVVLSAGVESSWLLDRCANRFPEPSREVNIRNIRISLMMFIAEFLNVDLVEEIRTNSSTGIGSQATHQPASQLSLFSQSFSPTS